jgi:hypothetical protein
MNESANPSLDPANNDTLLGLLNVAIAKAMQQMDNVLPATVVAYDRVKNRAQVQPQIKMIDTNKNSITRAQIASIPVFQYGGNGYLLSFPLKSGSFGWIIACDRDISEFLQNYSESSPSTYRKKSFSDSFFLPDVMTGYTIASEDLENAVLQNIDGTVKISLSPDKIKVSAKNVEVDCEQLSINSSSNISINCSGNIILTTPQFYVSGNISASGTITPDSPPPP